MRTKTKRWITLLIALLMTFCLVACGSSSTTTQEETPNLPTVDEADMPSDSADTSAGANEGTDLAKESDSLSSSNEDVPASEKEGDSVVSMPTKDDYEPGPVWDIETKPDYENGPWAQSYALLHDLQEQAALYDDVTPEHIYSLACHDPAESGPGQIIGSWATSVKVASKGKIVINVGYSGTLSGAMTSMDDMKQGTIDFVWTLPCYFKGYMPLINVIQNPALQIPDGAVGSYAMWELFKTEPALQSEADEHGKALFACANCTSPISYKGNEEITDISAIVGNIRANNGPAQTFVNVVNGNIYGCPIGDVYNNVKTGIISYLITDWNGIDSFQLSDKGVCNYYVDTNIGCSAFALLCNHSIWDSMDEETQDLLLSVAGDYMLNFVDIWNYWEASGRYNARAQGGDIFAPSETLAGQLEQAYDEVATIWVQEQADADQADALYAHAKELVEKYSASNHT